MMTNAIPATPDGHPLRRQLGLQARRIERKRARAVARERDDDDIKLFVLSYTAFFVCFYTFLL